MRPPRARRRGCAKRLSAEPPASKISPGGGLSSRRVCGSAASVRPAPFARRALSLFLAIVLAAGLAPAIPGIHAPEAAFAEGGANSTVTITHQPVGGEFALGYSVRLYARAYSPDNHLLSYSWFRSENATPSPSTDASVGGNSSTCDDKPQQAGTYYYYVVVEDASTGASATSVPAKATVNDIKDMTGKDVVGTSLVNGDFSQEGDPADHYSYHINVPGWETTQYAKESWKTTSQKIIEINTTKRAELSADYDSSLYQHVSTVPGTIYQWGLNHSGKGGTDTMALVIGPPSFSFSGAKIGYGRFKEDYQYGINTQDYFAAIVKAAETQNGGSLIAGKDYSVRVNLTTAAYDPNGASYYVRLMTSPVGSPTPYSGTYTVPEDQGVTVFAFTSYKSANEGAANFLQDIKFSAEVDFHPSDDVGYEGDGQLSVDAQDGFVYGIVEERGSTTMAAASTVAFEGETLPVSDLGKGTSDWYAAPGAGQLVFGNLTPGKTYRIVGVPKTAVNTTLTTNLNPGLVLDDGYYESVTIKPVADSSGGAGGNIQATAQKVGGSASIIVRPARADVEYALVEANAAGTGAASPVVPAKDKDGHEVPWSTPASGEGSLAFSNLALGRSYVIVARPKGYDEIGHADQVAAGSFVVVKTPSENFVDVSPDDGSVVRAAGEASDSVTVTNKSTQTQRYLVYDAVTGAATDGAWHELQPGTTDAWPGLDAAGVYQVVAAEPSTAAGAPGSAPSPGVRAYPAAPDPDIDYAAETVGKGGVVPKTVEFRLKDNGTGEYYRGAADSWEQGTGGSPVSLTEYLDRMAAGGAGAELSYRAHADYGPAVYVERSVTVPARPAAPELGASGYAFDYADEGIAPGADAPGDVQARSSGDSEWKTGTADVPVALSDLGWTGAEKTVQVRMAAVKSSSFASAANTAARVPSRSAAPDVTLLSSDNGRTYVFDGPDAPVSQYRVYGSANEGDWAACENASPQKGKTYEVRKKAGLGEFASNAVLRSASEAQLHAVAGDFQDVAYGYAEGPAVDLVLTNPGKNTAAVNAPYADEDPSVRIVMTRSPQSYKDVYGDAAAFSVEGEAARILATGAGAAGDATAQSPVNWRIKAKGDLFAGTYEAQIVVAFRDGGTGGDASVFYAAMGTVSLVVDKATPASPSLSLAGVTDTTARLSASSDDPHPVSIEYSTATSWGYGGSSTLTGLGPATCYEFYARTAADANHNASQPAMVRACTAHAAPDADAARFDFAAETVSFPAGCELRAAASGAGAEVASGSSVTGYVGQALYLRQRATGDEAGDFEGYVPASGWTSVAVPARPSIAASTTVENAADSRNPDGKVTVSGVAEFQYRKVSDAGWTRVQGASMALPAGAYEVRVPATGSAFASVPLPFAIAANNYFATFDLAGGGIEPADAAAEQYVASGGTASRPSPDPKRAGYDFAGWHAVSADGTVEDAEWAFDRALTSDVTLAAKWTPHACTVRFDSGVDAGEAPGVSGSMADQPFVYGEVQHLSACALVRANYEFAGWSETKGGPVKYADGAEASDLTPEDNGVVVLYAVWKRPAIDAAVPVTATVVVDGSGAFSYPSDYRIASTTKGSLRVSKIGFQLEAGADGIFSNACEVVVEVNGTALKAGEAVDAPADGFRIGPSADGAAPSYLPLSLSLTRPGGTMTHAEKARPFATVTYTLEFDDASAAASGTGA